MESLERTLSWILIIYPMPEVIFKIKWPSGDIECCYSPSTSILNYLEAGKSYSVEDFVSLSSKALEIASQKVMEKYGFRCTSAENQASKILATAKSFEAKETVTCLSME